VYPEVDRPVIEEKGNGWMRNSKFHHKRNIMQGGILVVLLLTLFTMMNFATVAHAQQKQAFRFPLVAQLQQTSSGSADISWNPRSQALAVTLHLRGLQPGSNHAAHIHVGTCSARGEILYPFQNIVANRAGDAVSTITFHNVAGGIPATDWNITVHRGATAKTGDLLCGNIVNPRRARSVSVLLRASP
jgi:hypothetical protein